MDELTTAALVHGRRFRRSSVCSTFCGLGVQMSITRHYKGATTDRPHATRPGPSRPDDAVIPRACTAWRHSRGHGCNGAQTRLHEWQARRSRAPGALARRCTRSGSIRITLARDADGFRIDLDRGCRSRTRVPQRPDRGCRSRTHVPRRPDHDCTSRTRVLRRQDRDCTSRTRVLRRQDRVCKLGSWPAPGANPPAQTADASAPGRDRACTRAGAFRAPRDGAAHVTDGFRAPRISSAARAPAFRAVRSSSARAATAIRIDPELVRTVCARVVSRCTSRPLDPSRPAGAVIRERPAHALRSRGAKIGRSRRDSSATESWKSLCSPGASSATSSTPMSNDSCSDSPLASAP
jgi:hypothetical protein